MFVSKRMSANPVTIPPTMTVAEATNLMKSNKFRRLPVVENGKLVGIVTDRDLRQVSPSPATTLSIFELNYLLAKMQVREIMKTEVITINVDAAIEEAALLMYTHKIGGLVVVAWSHQYLPALARHLAADAAAVPPSWPPIARIRGATWPWP